VVGVVGVEHKRLESLDFDKYCSCNDSGYNSGYVNEIETDIVIEVMDKIHFLTFAFDSVGMLLCVAPVEGEHKRLEDIAVDLKIDVVDDDKNIFVDNVVDVVDVVDNLRNEFELIGL